MMNDNIYDVLNKLIPNPVSELDYNKDYELLLATILSAQSTDVRVNQVTKELFSKYNLKTLSEASDNEIEKIIKSVGSYRKKTQYIINSSKSLIKYHDGKVPNDRTYLESLPGVGRKTANVVLKNLFNVPAIPVDTHVERVSKRLGFANEKDNVKEIELKLMKIIPKDKWNRVGDQILLFGRYYCVAIKPDCKNCLLLSECKNPVNK